MSKGFGPIQRRVIAIYEQNPDAEYDAFQLAAKVYDVAPAGDGVCYVTDAQASAVRRALVALRKAGHVEYLGYGHPGGRKQWLTPAASERRRQAQVNKLQIQEWARYGY